MKHWAPLCKKVQHRQSGILFRWVQIGKKKTEYGNKWSVFVSTAVAMNVNQPRNADSFVAQHKQALPELWNLKLTEKLFYYKFAFLFFVSAKKVRCFSPLICGDACSMSSVVEKAKMQFVIVRSIVKGKNHLWVCSVHAQMHTQADDTNIVCMVSRVSASVCRVFHRRDKSNGHD